MKATLLFFAGLLCGAALIAFVPHAAGHLHAAMRSIHGEQSSQAPASARAHTEEHFSFTAHAPMDQVAPLFGADKERLWSPGWNPQFVHPLPPADEPGMVFTVAHDHLHANWVNTELDLKNGRVTYVYVIPDALVTIIRLRLTPQANDTLVDVQYDRTALSPETDSHVRHMADGDRSSGPDWEHQINDYLEKTKR